MFTVDSGRGAERLQVSFERESALMRTSTERGLPMNTSRPRSLTIVPEPATRKKL
jgi:hypothetical protein